MDDFIGQFFSSSSWTDDKASGRSSWVGNLDQTNGLLADAIGAYYEDDEDMPASLTPSSHIVDSFITEDTSLFVDGDSNFDLDKSLLPGESQQLQGDTDHGIKPSPLGLVDGNLKPCYRDLHLNTPSTMNTLNYGSPELHPVAIDPANLPSVQPESGSVGSNDSEVSEIRPTLGESHSLTSLPHLWHPSSYNSVSSLSPDLVQDNLQGLGMPGQYVETRADIPGSNNFKDDHILQGNLPALFSVNGQHELQNHYLSSFASGCQIPLGRTADIHPQMQLNEGNSIKHYIDQSSISQLPHMSATAAGGCNGAAKPRVRARRGQATDPHSIAERLRREKIAERMKNLQELVPNSNKADKASMLDEMIDYVKFLQLQVKVLSMSRLGAAGAVVPLITDSQAEGSTGLVLSQSHSPNDLAFEQEVVKLMESSMTTAIQFLQSKGLCLMPLALATAISSTKASSGAIEGKKPIFTNRRVRHNNGENVPSNGCDETIVKGEVLNCSSTRSDVNPDEA